MDRRILGLALTCLMMMACVVSVPFSASESDAVDPDYSSITSLHGRVFEIPYEKDRAPISGVTVTTWTSAGKEYESYPTGDDGYFTVKFNSDVSYISFTKEEFKVQGVSSELRAYGITGMYEIVLNDDSEIDGVHELMDSNGFTALISRTSASVIGNVTTIVDGEVEPVSNASVTLSSDRTTLRTNTDSDGYFSINCSTGVNYQLTITSSGLEDWVQNNVQPSDLLIQIQMDAKDHTIILGFDMAHTFALFGILILVVVVLVFVILITRPEKVDGLYVVNDLPPRKKKEEED